MAVEAMEKRLLAAGLGYGPGDQDPATLPKNGGTVTVTSQVHSFAGHKHQGKM